MSPLLFGQNRGDAADYGQLGQSAAEAVCKTWAVMLVVGITPGWAAVLRFRSVLGTRLEGHAEHGCIY